MTENRETTYMPYTETEREIDLKQLLLVICVKWKLLLLCAVIGLAAGAAYGMLRAQPAPAAGTESATVTYDEALEAYEKATMDKENWLTYYDSWTEQAYALLEQGMPEEVPAEQTEIEVTYNAMNLMIMLNSLKSTKGSVEKWEVPEKPVPGMAAAADGSSIQKWALIGCVGGLFFAAFALALYEILRGRILSSEELNARYGLRPIGVLTMGKEPDKLLKQFGADHYHLQMSKQEQQDVIASNLSVYAANEKEVLLTGSVDREKLQELADELHAAMPAFTFETAPHILSNVASLQRLKDHAQVILVEQALRSVYKDVDREMQLLHDRKLLVTGSVMLY